MKTLALLVAILAIMFTTSDASAHKGRLYAHAHGGPGVAFIHGHNICAENVNRLRAHLGLRATGSAAAASFLGLPHTSKPVYGSVMYVPGHVALYAGNGMCWNPSSRHQQWDLKSCGNIWPGRHRTWIR